MNAIPKPVDKFCMRLATLGLSHAADAPVMPEDRHWFIGINHVDQHTVSWNTEEGFFLVRDTGEREFLGTDGTEAAVALFEMIGGNDARMAP